MAATKRKFNLVGPDLSADEWATWSSRSPAVWCSSTPPAAAFRSCSKLAGRGRIVLTATDSAAQQFETVFPRVLRQGVRRPAADPDKNGRVSIWEAFTYASAGVRRWFEERGQLPTERPLLDDTGDGVGREAQNPGPDGAVARVTYLQPVRVAAATAARRALSAAGELELRSKS